MCVRRRVYPGDIDTRRSHQVENSPPDVKKVIGNGNIPNVVNHSLSRFDPAQLPTDKPVVLVCVSGARSARAGNSGWKGCGGAKVI